MVRTSNPLDVFSTYTIHYELHASANAAELTALETNDVNATTTPSASNGTLLINTRKDAHQTIDDVVVEYFSPVLDASGAMTPVGDITFSVREPNGTYFTEKILAHAKRYQVTDIIAGLIFALKIIFVGRTPDNQEVTLTGGRILLLAMTNMAASFDQRGGEYQLQFVYSGSALGITSIRPNDPLARAAAYSNKNISITARTVREAVKQLEDKLNSNYDNLYQHYLKTKNAKPIKYVLEIDPRIDGNLNLINRDSWAPGEPAKLLLPSTIDIAGMLRIIVSSSREVNEMISASSDGIRKQFHPGVKIPTYSAMWVPEPDRCVAYYRVNLYEGGQVPESMFEFDYYFSGAGKNVDITQFDVKFPQMNLWIGTSLWSTPLNTNIDARVPNLNPTQFTSNTLTADKTLAEIKNPPRNTSLVSASSGDPALVSAVPPPERSGHVNTEHDAVPAAKLAFETIAKFGMATDLMFTFTMRGHLSLLNKAVISPDLSDISSSNSSFGITNGLWIKVNIFNADGQRFFYTGWYRVLSITNRFVGGTFVQQITVMMIPDQPTS